MHLLKLVNQEGATVSSPVAIKRLIDIFWSNIVNSEVIEKSLSCMLTADSLPKKLELYMELMMERQLADNPCNPFLIIEPYGERLEELDQDYFSHCRALFYQEK